MTKIAYESLTHLAAAIRSHRLSPVELTEAVLDQIDTHNASLHAYISVYREDAIETAQRAEQEIMAGNYRGPLHGIPMGLKDNLFMAGRRTTIGSKIHADFVPAYDATAVRKLSAAGVVILGKLNMHEYALGVTSENPYFGTCRNPWDTEKSTGGSSGGAGAAIPAGMSIGSIGSDTSGSIRIPAACCGIVGLKPTYGRVSRYGCFPESWSLDHVGPLARTVGDTATILDGVSGHDPSDPASLNRPPTRTADALATDLHGVVVGINDAFFFRDVDNAVAAVIEDGLRCLTDRGATLRRVDIPGIENAEYAITMIDTSESTTVHHQNLRERAADYGDDVRYLLECGELPSAVDYLEAQQIRARLRESFQNVFRDVDVLAGPTLPIETPRIGVTTASINGRPADRDESLMRLVGPSNLVGLPSISVPCGLLNGMPVGMQVVGPALGEQSVLNAAAAIEESGTFVMPTLP